MNEREQRFEKLILETYPNRCKPLTESRESDIYYGFQDGWKARQEEINILRNVCAEAYQLVGCFCAPVKALDNLSAAANGEPIPHESFLPVENESELYKANARIAQLEEFVIKCSGMKGEMINGNSLSKYASELLSDAPNTWLTEHDKAVEVGALEEFATKWLPNLKHKDMQSSISQVNHNFVIDDCIKHAYSMIEARKTK